MPSVTFIVPALNEERNIEPTVVEIRKAVEGRYPEHEIVIVDDGSTDSTGAIADRLAAADPRVRVHHNPKNRGLGAAYRTGVELARCEYLLLVPGDNQFPASSMLTVLEKVGQADIVVPYTSNPEVRPWGRRLLSVSYTTILNVLFGLSLKYYNGTVVHRTALVKACPNTTDGFAYQAEILIKLLRRGASHVHVGVPITERDSGVSTALRPKNVVRVFRAVAGLLWEVYGGGGAGK